MDAVERAGELMMMPKRELPKIALDYSRHLCSQVGGCMEVMITAFAYYAQAVEKLECDDRAYAISPDAVEWFAAQGVAV